MSRDHVGTRKGMEFWPDYILGSPKWHPKDRLSVSKWSNHSHPLVFLYRGSLQKKQQQQQQNNITSTQVQGFIKNPKLYPFVRWCFLKGNYHTTPLSIIPSIEALIPCRIRMIRSRCWSTTMPEMVGRSSQWENGQFEMNPDEGMMGWFCVEIFFGCWVYWLDTFGCLNDF